MLYVRAPFHRCWLKKQQKCDNHGILLAREDIQCFPNCQEGTRLKGNVSLAETDIHRFREYFKPNSEMTHMAFNDHIEKDSIVVHDGNNSHSLFIKKLNFKSEAHLTSETEGLEDSDNPMNPVNGIHFLFKSFIGERRRCWDGRTCSYLSIMPRKTAKGTGKIH